MCGAEPGKADLLTEVVGEFPDPAGPDGGDYALPQGEYASGRRGKRGPRQAARTSRSRAE